MGNRLVRKKTLKSTCVSKGKNDENEMEEVAAGEDGHPSSCGPTRYSELNRFATVVKNVLQKSRMNIVEKLVPDLLLDHLEEQQVFNQRSHIIMRDIRDAKDTTIKNRQIQDLFYTRPMQYTDLKKALAVTGQKELLSDLENLELLEHSALEEPCRCTSTATCPLLQKLEHQKISVSTPTNKRVQVSEIQRQLIDMYRETCGWENPVMMDEEVDPHMSMYVRPAVNFIKEKDCHGTLTERKDQQSKTPKLTYQRIFSETEAGTCKNIYITGDAGAGKTSFCNQLVLDWCNAIQNRKASTICDENQMVLTEFTLLFYINLRNFETIYHVHDMIKEQLFQDENDPNTRTVNVSELMQRERCLIVLDGLDEWSCPDGVKRTPGLNKYLPGRITTNKTCAVLTTTRNWKYDIIELKTKDVDKHIELCGIDEKASDELTKKVINYLERKSNTGKKYYEFFLQVHEKRLTAFTTVPVLLIQLITLWHAGKDFGNSQLQLYSCMLDLLFERSKKNLPEETKTCPGTSETNPKLLPNCFNEQYFCQRYADLIHCLAELAYKALFNDQKEEALVFKSSNLEIFGISPSDLQLCLRCGILSQSKVYGIYTGKHKSFSFLHKKVQEYLAAIYIATCDNVEDILKELKEYCNSLESMLEMNQVWLFVAGVRPDLARLLFEHLADVVCANDQVQQYRKSLDSSTSSDFVEKTLKKLVKDIQKCVNDGLSEGKDNGHTYEHVCLEDICLDDFRDVDSLIQCYDMSKVKSVYISTDDFDRFNTDEAILSNVSSQLQHCHSVRKLYLYDRIFGCVPIGVVEGIVENNCDTLTSLYLLASLTATDKFISAICNSISKSLVALGLHIVKMTHGQKEQILNSLSLSSKIEELELRLYCTEHGWQCRPRIDLSAMTRVEALTLHSVQAENLPSVVRFVEYVELIGVILPMAELCDFATEIANNGLNVKVKITGFEATETRNEQETFDPETIKRFFAKLPRLALTEYIYSEQCNIWDIEFKIKWG